MALRIHQRTPFSPYSKTFNELSLKSFHKFLLQKETLNSRISDLLCIPRFLEVQEFCGEYENSLQVYYFESGIGVDKFLVSKEKKNTKHLNA